MSALPHREGRPILHAPHARVPAHAPRRTLPLAVLVLSTGAAVFWAGSAVAQDVAAAWGLTGSGAAALAWSVQGGFIVGTLLTAGLNLPDRFPPARLVAAFLTVAAVANGALVFADGNLPAAIALRFLAGAFAGPVYPMGMKLLATWWPRLGWQLGVLLAFNTLGFGAAFILRAASFAWTASLLTVSALALAGAVLAVLFLRQGPLLPARSRFDPAAAARAFRVREYRRSAFGYFGHMWELFAFWAVLPFWLTAAGVGTRAAVALAAGVFAAGALGCLAAGAWSRRAGEARAARAALVVSAACCLASPFLFGAPLVVLAPVVLVWGAAVIADSAMFSSISARAAPREYVGTALTTQNTIGFAITIGSIALLPAFADAVGSWRFTLLLLAPGPLLALVPVQRLVRTDA